MHSAVAICEHWEKAIKILTTQFWPSFTSHPWVPTKVECWQPIRQLRTRIEEVLKHSSLSVLIRKIHSVRSVHHQLARLLSGEDLLDVDGSSMDRSFEVFQGVVLLECNIYTEKQWKVGRHV